VVEDCLEQRHSGRAMVEDEVDGVRAKEDDGCWSCGVEVIVVL